MGRLEEEIINFNRGAHKDIYMLSDPQGMIEECIPDITDGKRRLSDFTGEETAQSILDELQLKGTIENLYMQMTSEKGKEPFLLEAKRVNDIPQYFLYFRSMRRYESADSVKHLLHTIVDAFFQLHDGYVVVYDTDLKLFSANDSYKDYIKKQIGCEYRTGLTLEEMCGDGRADFFRKKLKECLETGHVSYDRENLDGRFLHTEGKVVEVHDGLKLIVSYSKDITKEHIYFEELTKLNRSLEATVEKRTEELNKMLDNLKHFNSIMTHELKNPIKEINAYADFIREDLEGKIPDDSMEDIKAIQNICVETVRCIESFVTYSKSTWIDLKNEKIDTNSLIREIIEEVSVISGENPIYATLNEVPPIYGDAVLLKQALRNIVYNSVKYAKPGTTNRLVTGYMESDTEITYYFSDRGIGIKASDPDSLFNIFERGMNVGGNEGSGIGLAVVKSVVERHGGIVGILGEEGKGCCVYWKFGKSGK